MGGLRYVALALLAPLFGVPLAASAQAAPAPAHSSTAVAGHAGGAARSSRYAGRLRPPSQIRLLAARLYWGSRPPGTPSARSLGRDLRQTADYFVHVSRGREHVHPTVTRWVRVRASADTMCNTQHGSIRAATAALKHAGYRPGRFNRLMIVTEQCNSAASAAQLPGRVSWVRFRSPGMATLVHELGHNLGLEHAYGVVCREGGHRVALGGRCRSVEYGDSWDAMGHSRGFFSAPALVRLGWAGTIQHVRSSRRYHLADVQHSGSANQALRIDAGSTTYWVEYQPEHSPVVGRTIPGVMIRRQVGRGPVELIDASPGNPTGIAYPDGDLTNAALPVGSSLTTPEQVRITTVATGRGATVQVTFEDPAAAPDAPVVDSVVQVGGEWRVRWSAPADNGQIVLGYRVTSLATGQTRYVRGPAGYRTSMQFRAELGESGTPAFTVEALNQQGWSPAGGTPAGTPPAVSDTPST